MAAAELLLPSGLLPADLLLSGCRIVLVSGTLLSVQLVADLASLTKVATANGAQCNFSLQ